MEKSTKDIAPSQKNVNRRRALKAIAAASGGIAATKWVRPVVESVVLPAHAQTTGTIYSMTCVGTPPSGTIVFPPYAVSSVVTITPNPGAGQTVVLEGFCDGAGPIWSDTMLTDASGQIFSTGNITFCAAGGTAMIRFSYTGASTECNWILGIS